MKKSLLSENSAALLNKKITDVAKSNPSGDMWFIKAPGWEGFYLEDEERDGNFSYWQLYNKDDEHAGTISVENGVITMLPRNLSESKKMKKSLLSEEIKRMKELAGIISESDKKLTEDDKFWQDRFDYSREVVKNKESFGDINESGNFENEKEFWNVKEGSVVLYDKNKRNKYGGYEEITKIKLNNIKLPKGVSGTYSEFGYIVELDSTKELLDAFKNYLDINKLQDRDNYIYIVYLYPTEQEVDNNINSFLPDDSEYERSLEIRAGA